jgi:hypothetical protein
MNDDVTLNLKLQSQFFLIHVCSLHFVFQFTVIRVGNFGVVFMKIGERWSEIFLIIRITEQNAIKMYIVLHVKYPLLSSDFNDT